MRIAAWTSSSKAASTRHPYRPRTWSRSSRRRHRGHGIQVGQTAFAAETRGRAADNPFGGRRSLVCRLRTLRDSNHADTNAWKRSSCHDIRLRASWFCSGSDGSEKRLLAETEVARCGRKTAMSETGQHPVPFGGVPSDNATLRPVSLGRRSWLCSFQRLPLRTLQTLFKLERHQYDGYAIPGVAYDIDYPHNVNNVQAALTLQINDSVGASAEFRPESAAQIDPRDRPGVQAECRFVGGRRTAFGALHGENYPPFYISDERCGRRNANLQANGVRI